MPLVDHGQHPELPAVGQLVMHKIHGPILTTGGGDRDGATMQADALPATHSHTDLETLQLVQPVYAVAPHPPALSGQQDMQALVTEAGPGRGQFAQPLPQNAAVARLRAVVPAAVSQAAQRAGAAHAELEAVSDPSDIERGLADAHLAADISNDLADLRLLEGKQNLLLGELRLLHRSRSSPCKDPGSTLLQF